MGSRYKNNDGGDRDRAAGSAISLAFLAIWRIAANILIPEQR